MSDTVQVKIKLVPGKPFKMGEVGYMAVRGKDVVAFYLDAWTNTGRAYNSSTCDQVYITETGEWRHFPSIMLDDGDEFESNFAVIYFPEFEGWQVHSVSGGKTMSICLVRKS